MTADVIHVEMRERYAFCDAYLPADDDYVRRISWQAGAESIQAATCPECLAAIYMLGDSAAIALGRLGLKIEVRDATEAEANPS